MRIESKLCHISENKAVVLVNGWLEDKNVGSALAEGTTVEDAEDKAISRLNKRLNIFNGKEEKVIINNTKLINKPSAVELPISDKYNPPLRNNDIVYVPTNNFAKATGALGTVANPLTNLVTILSFLKLVETY